MNIEMRFMNAVAYAQLYGVGLGEGDYDAGLVMVSWLEQFFANRTITSICEKNVGSHDGENAAWLQRGSGLHLYADEIPYNSQMYRLKVRAVGIDVYSLKKWLNIDVPEQFAGMFEYAVKGYVGHEEIRQTTEFQEWRKTLGIEAPKPRKASVTAGRTATVQNTGLWVTKLSYTPAEAAAEIARIEEASLPSRSKAAFKAHVSRRVSSR